MDATELHPHPGGPSPGPRVRSRRALAGPGECGRETDALFLAWPEAPRSLPVKHLSEALTWGFPRCYRMRRGLSRARCNSMYHGFHPRVLITARTAMNDCVREEAPHGRNSFTGNHPLRRHGPLRPRCRTGSNVILCRIFLESIRLAQTSHT